MKSRMERAVEVTALVVIGGAAALGGRETLQHVHDHFLIPAILGLVVLGALALWTLMRLVRENRPDSRISVSKRVAYLAALGLGLCAVIEPARWAVGGCIAALELAIGFDIVSAFGQTAIRKD